MYRALWSTGTEPVPVSKWAGSRTYSLEQARESLRAHLSDVMAARGDGSPAWLDGPLVFWITDPEGSVVEIQRVPALRLA